MKQTNRLNNYILITQPYGKCKESYTSVRGTAHKILFIIGRRIPEMPHVEGDDDGVGYGVYGNSNSGNGVFGKSPGGNGVYGVSQGMGGYGVYGESKELRRQWRVWQEPQAAMVYMAFATTAVVYMASVATALVCMARATHVTMLAILNGKVKITGNLEKAGGSFKIDHPLDPANKYLYHSFVESPDMKNVYDGVVVLDER